MISRVQQVYRHTLIIIGYIFTESKRFLDDKCPGDSRHGADGLELPGWERKQQEKMKKRSNPGTPEGLGSARRECLDWRARGEIFCLTFKQASRIAFFFTGNLAR